MSDPKNLGDNLDYDVAIVGAGAAGLAAAHALCQKSLRVALVEARGRIGGRVWTQAPGIELGAEFIHGTPQTTWELIKKSGLTAHEINGAHAALLDGRFEYREEFWNELEHVFKHLGEDRNQDRSFKEFLESCAFNQNLKERAISFVEGFHAARIDELSERSLAHEENCANQIEGYRAFRLDNGYMELINWLYLSVEDKIDCYLNSPVNLVHLARNKIELKTTQRTFLANCVILTLPVGVLKKGSVRVLPDIFSKRESKGQALDYLRSGPVTKIILEFKSRFWEDFSAKINLGFIHGSGLPFPSWWGTLPKKYPILTGWAGGPSSERLSELSQSALLNQAYQSIGKLFQMKTSSVKNLMVNWYYHNWQLDPFAEGAYSYIAKGGIEAPFEIAKPFEDRLFFAGEATETQRMRGTVDGAIASGQRAGHEVLEALGLSRHT